ncbi:hypothetical protein LAZ67_15002721 [Cordylochernes scorpioides]|uniref:Uncharacterized protein n=1 Tax=Cordylochernes scorpioides TaxID=51811 RepID=A0ABY6LCE1_9ARAC|nr:hypothetical protein LAZ67_15002721 [Cordylochernes scorpioides]
MKIAAFSFTEWITEGKESQHETPEKTVFNIKTGSSYTIDKMTGECQFHKNEFAPRLRMPDKSHLAFDNPELFVEGLGFYKADTINDDRGYRTIVYEKQAEDFFMGSDYRYPKASITRYYLEDDTHSVREPGTDNIPSKIVLKLKSADGMADLTPKEMAASDMRNKHHVQPLLTWSTNAPHPVSLDQEPLQGTINRAS